MTNLCEIPTCTLCKLLPNQSLELLDTIVDKNQTQITLKKTVKNSEGGYTYPLTSREEFLINDNCYTAILRSCKKGFDGGDEAVKISDYNSDKGIVTLIRDNPINHVCLPIKLVTGEITPMQYNQMVEIICQLKESVCATFPPYATVTQAGIGKASSISVENIGKPPIFITTDDANWQLILAKIGADNDTSVFGRMLKYITAPTKCSNDLNNNINLDLLINTIDAFCGYELCTPKLLEALCGSVEAININGVPTGIAFKDRYIEPEYGIKEKVLWKSQRQGAITESAYSTMFSVVNSFPSGNALEIDMTGRTTTQEIIYESAEVTLPITGYLSIEGGLGSKFNSGATIGAVRIKQGSITTGSQITLFGNNVDGKVGNPYGKKFSDTLPAGTYTLEFFVRFVPNPAITISGKAQVFDFNNYVIFNPNP